MSVESYLKDYMFGGPFRVMSYPGSLEGDARAQQLLTRTEADVTETRAALGYAPSTPIEVGVKRFVDWYRRYHA